MAANLQNQRLVSMGKRFINQISDRNQSLSSSSLFIRRTVQASAYDKNPEEHAHNPALIPDDAIPPISEKYWAPHPRTGVFVPSSEKPAQAGGERNFRNSTETHGADSVLEEKTFFRPLEDLEKPEPPPSASVN